MIKVSRKLIIVLFVFLIIASINILIAFIVIKDIESDAMLVNYTGIIRGGIQRICKLELLNMPDDKLIDEIENKIDLILFKKYQISIFKNEEDKFIKIEKFFKIYWEDLKTHIFKYRKNPSKENKDLLIKKSELIWIEANDVVFYIENISEKKVKNFNYLIISIVLNLLLILLEIFIINRIVKGKLEYFANYDFLTNILNRNSFDILLKKEIDIAKRHKRIFSLIMIDIDFFKNINDTFGHDMGDYVLTRLSKLLSENIRKTDYFARIGGEEFLIIDFEQEFDKVKALAEKLRKIIEKSKFKKNIKIKISLGITQYKINDSKESILKRVDNALYKAKKNGRNRLEIKL